MTTSVGVIRLMSIVGPVSLVGLNNSKTSSASSSLLGLMIPKVSLASSLGSVDPSASSADSLHDHNCPLVGPLLLGLSLPARQAIETLVHASLACWLLHYQLKKNGQPTNA